MQRKTMFKLFLVIVLFAGIGFCLMEITNYFTGSVIQNPIPLSVVESPELYREFNITAFSFGYDPSMIKVKKNSVVKLRLIDEDVPHGIRIPGFNIVGENTVEFTASESGEFPMFCYIDCDMVEDKPLGVLVVEE